jgi:putative acetyltransferase
MHELTIRPIVAEDNPVIAKLIRDVLTEFGAAKPGTVFTDPTTDRLFELFQAPKSAYFIAETDGEILGGCGIYPTTGLPAGCTELVKLYLSAKARGKGIGKALMERSFEAALAFGYAEIYLETLPELHIAVGLYERLGFTYLEQPYGDSGHYACDLWMIRQL